MRMQTCRMDPRYYGKIDVNGETIILEPFREIETLFAYMRADGSDPDTMQELAAAVGDRIAGFPPVERWAWVGFLDAVFELNARLAHEGEE